MSHTPADEAEIASYQLSLTARSVVGPLTAIIAILALAHVAAALATYVLRLPIPEAALRPFDLNDELGFGTLFSTLLLIAASLLLLVTGTDARRRRAWDARSWFVLAAGFALMAVDEAASIHEIVQGPIRERLRLSGPFFYAWIIPYTTLVVALSPFLFRFLRRLPSRTRRDFVIAGAIYLIGAIGMEVVEGQMQDAVGFHSFPMEMAFLAEEVLEMFGVAYFVAAILSHLEARGKPLRVTIDVPRVREIEREVPLEPWQLADHLLEQTPWKEPTVRP